jgi:hypothetical protein
MAVPAGSDDAAIDIKPESDIGYGAKTKPALTEPMRVVVLLHWSISEISRCFAFDLATSSNNASIMNSGLLLRKSFQEVITRRATQIPINDT